MVGVHMCGDCFVFLWWVQVFLSGFWWVSGGGGCCLLVVSLVVWEVMGLVG